ncbi:uncharacterized protein N7469_005479 [Penicillium citrinum]|uniref:Uncharacterized protein n=1 Tax=Penicillium citrinum TaxID=5077 RepID=A0A9W9P492_PENCI|nr:uncharacterized protein N7469_005479 [Penicillium citrinum]KAJ5233713.1 hypothetical protein N7469_005479 [Penicillium citrinum]KAK5790291.1 hypothetical protein VI817_007578 [Penicillium citrinum]
MAIKSEPVSDLITIDNQYLSRVTTRRNIMTNYQKTVHGCLPGGETAVFELYTFLLAHYLPTRFPTIFTVSKNSFHNKVTGKTFPTTPPQDPETCLRILGETVEEDIFLLKETETTHVCLAFTCCFPTGFDPSSKLGLGLTSIHGPVPSYEKIGPSMERFFRKLEVGKSVKRMNLLGNKHLIKERMRQKLVMAANLNLSLYKANLRIELQSLTRLPETKFVLFCFKTYLYPLADIKAEGTGSELADAIEGLQKGNAPGMFKYKSAVRWGKSVAEYLRS